MAGTNSSCILGDIHLPATIAEAGRQMRKGLLTSEVLVKHYLERSKTLNPHLNAFITITEDLALETAATLDAELKSRDRGPLHGIPIVLKDNIDTAGIKLSDTLTSTARLQNRT